MGIFSTPRRRQASYANCSIPYSVLLRLTHRAGGHRECVDMIRLPPDLVRKFVKLQIRSRGSTERGFGCRGKVRPIVREPILVQEKSGAVKCTRPAEHVPLASRRRRAYNRSQNTISGGSYHGISYCAGGRGKMEHLAPDGAAVLRHRPHPWRAEVWTGLGRPGGRGETPGPPLCPKTGKRARG